MAFMKLLALFAGVSSVAYAAPNALVKRAVTTDSCPGYKASNVVKDGNAIVSADLSLAGTACNVYGTDLTDLKLQVEYQTSERFIHTLLY